MGTQPVSVVCVHLDSVFDAPHIDLMAICLYATHRPSRISGYGHDL